MSYGVTARTLALSVAVLVVSLCVVVADGPYSGPANVCVNFTPGARVLSGWCSATNPFGQRPKLLTDYVLDSRIFSFEPVCKGNGEAYDICYSMCT
jgi:hypothetical protein